MIFDILQSEHDTIKIPNIEVNRSHDYLTLLKVAWLTLETVDSSQEYVMFCIVSKELSIKN